MASNPQLPNHLIRELMHAIRLKGKGDAMVTLALSGKEPFSVFRYVVETHIYAWIGNNYISLESRQGFTQVYLKFLTDGSKRLAIRFVRELQACDTPSKPLPFEKIIELTIVRSFDKSFTPTLNSLSDLEILKLDFFPYAFDEFFGEVNDGNISLSNLRKLEIRLSLDELFKVVSTTSSFPLPEDVTFYINDYNIETDHGPLQTFSNVKHLNISGNVDREMTSAVHQFTNIINSTASKLPNRTLL